jgi:hypothetical protein
MSQPLCKYCQQPIIWATDHERRSKVPLEPRPDNNLGKYLLDLGQMTAIQLDAEMIQRAIENRDPLYINHLLVCPELNRARSGSPWGREIGDTAA